MNIRNLLLAFTVLFSLVAIATAIVLITSTTRLQTMTTEISRSVQSVRASEKIQLELISHYLAWQGIRPALPLDDGARDLEVHRQTITTLMASAMRDISTDTERTLAERLDVALSDYFKLTAEPAPLASNHRRDHVATSLQHAFSLTVALTETNAEYSHEVEKASVRAGRTAELLGVIFSLLFAAVLLTTWIALRQLIYKPARELSQAISHYSGAKGPWRSSLRGPREFEVIAKAFAHLTTRLNESRNTQLRFIASVAHDLKNPLGAIRMSSELLADEEEVSHQERKAMVDIISRQAQLLERMVGDLLDATRIESGNLELRRGRENLTQLISNAVTLHQPLSTIHKITYSAPEEEIWCDCDPLRISQVMNNLLSNAIKYSPHGGMISINLAVADGKAVIRIKDEGIGIAPEEQSQIFEPFRRTDLTKSTIPGVGLGLSVTRKILAAHGGDIKVESRPEMGSTFIVSLPIRSGS